MIVKREEARVLVDREALSYLIGRSPHTIRAKLKPAMRDEKGRPLYVLDEAEKQLKDVVKRVRKRAA